MGCLQAKEKEEPEPPPPKEPEVKKVDPRLPFENYRQLFNMKNSWKAVGRTLTVTAKECLMRLFKAHPEYQKMHKNLARFDDMDKLMESTAFENAALDVFNLFDEVMETSDKVDMHIATLHRVGKAHAKIPGFTANYFKDMETPFMEAVKLSLGDRFTEATETNFQLLFNYIVDQMLIGYNQAGGQPGPDSNRV